MIKNSINYSEYEI